MVIKIGLGCVNDKLPKKLVIFEPPSSLTLIFSIGTKLNNVGSSVKVIVNDVINPKVIIHPKSIIGLISLNINDKKAIIVVRAVYRIGQNILLVVKIKISNFVFN